MKYSRQKFLKTFDVNKIFSLFLKGRLASNALIYTITSIINSAIPFLLLPILTNYLSPVEYGRISTFLVVISISTVFITLELHGILSVTYYKSSNLIRNYVFNIITLATITFVVIVLLTFSFSDAVEHAIELPVKYILLGELAAYFQFISLINLTIWQLEQKPKHFGSFQILNTLFNYGISVVLIVYAGFGEQGRIIAILLVAFLFAVFSISYLYAHKKVIFDLNAAIIKDSLKFGLPLLPHALSSWLVIGLDRILINNYVSIEQNGIYTTAFQIATIISIVGTSFNKAFIPFLFENLTEDGFNNKIKIVKITYLYFIFLIFCATILSVGSPIVLSILVDEKYYEASKYIVWVAFGAAADGMYYGVVNYIFYVKKTGYLTFITFSAGIIHVILSFLLIPRIGTIGAAYSTVTTQFVTFFGVWILSNKLYPMPWFSSFSKTSR